MNEKIILLVEDNPDDELLAQRAFNQHKRLAHNKVVVARDGGEALDYLFGTGLYQGRDLTVMPNLILLDLKLPKVTGLEVLKRLRASQNTKRLPVVVMTSSDEERDIIESYECGANSYIRKPVDFQEFADTIVQLHWYWLVLNEPPPR
jgi:CheY-like chemotaxis protein